jgi:hypothetical protein
MCAPLAGSWSSAVACTLLIGSTVDHAGAGRAGQSGLAMIGTMTGSTSP